MDTQETSIKLPSKLMMNTSYIIWGVIGMSMSVWFAVIAIIGDNIHTKSDLYSGIALILMCALCGIKLFYDGYKVRIVINAQCIVSKGISGEQISILWNEIDSVTLEKPSESIVIRSIHQTIAIPLKFKGWELILGVLEEKVADERFTDFN